MASHLQRAEQRNHALMPARMLLAFIGAALAVIAMSALVYRAQQSSVEANDWVKHTFEVMQTLELAVSAVKDAETGQRGFLLTGDERYLAPFLTAEAELAGLYEKLNRLTDDNPNQQQRLHLFERLAKERLALARQTVELWQKGDREGGVTLMRSGSGRELMLKIRDVAGEMRGEETRLLGPRSAEANESVRLATRVTWVGAMVLLAFIVLTGVMSSRDFRQRETEAWLRAGQAALGLRVQGEQLLKPLGESVLQFLAERLDAQIGAVFIKDGDVFTRFAGFGLPPDYGTRTLRVGDGLIGEAVRVDRIQVVQPVPAEHFAVATGTGQSTPKRIVFAPAHVDGRVNGLIELAFFREITVADTELLRRCGETFGAAVRSASDRQRLQDLLEETQRQAEELQTQQEELRVSNEELEEQSRVLKESQARLEAQQAELEQTNSQLEEQAQMLETQRDELSAAGNELRAKAAELDRSNQYKSEFLANMSHELRTPLNSSLILAKLLADNKEGNLTAQQVEFATTISSAGNDLLALINDILDLSKIESGNAQMQIETVSVPSLIARVEKGFRPVADNRQLGFDVRIDPNTAASMQTDAQRVTQILNNLLANAFKFTSAGRVTLEVAPVGSDRVSFAVTDTGIGVPASQHDVIFQAFRQADGSTHRKYGGTGLGLSISRDLARLLGGDVSVKSAPGEGSTFTLVLPVTAAANVAPPPPSRVVSEKPRIAPVRAAPIADDRQNLREQGRVILAIEDDPHFAKIMRDLARELDFQCIIATSGAEGLAAAKQFRPSAIVLDMNLPDQRGLVVLDELKRTPETRHIPVHVISVEDYTQEARERGAIGYALKPVKREELVAAFKRLEERMAQKMRRVLVVEDDERQRGAIQQLLGGGNVQIVGVATGAEAQRELAASTYDCMVMDLNLPDVSGAELLRKMSEAEDTSFPPVIIYTGRALTRDEEQSLRRYSKSIIIKDARSPERLLDEVTLFLHQVEAALPLEHQRMLRQARSRDEALEGKRVLVVEDDVRNIFALSNVLEQKGCKIEIARNGKEALALLQRPSPGIELVLMDIMMPEMDGVTATREIRKLPQHAKLPIIALTAKAMPDDREKCFAAGMNDYIAKPLDVEKLLSLVRVWMPK